jgi:Cu-Zn family superoxide dismutase
MPTTNTKVLKGIAVFQNKLSGYVSFIQINNRKGDSKVEVRVNGMISGLKKGKHGIHIHRYGNLMSVDCSSCGGHFNPFNKQHGGRFDKNSHAGDLGNITANENGIAKFRFVIYDKITMKGVRSIFGRSIVIHEGVDDLGKGGHSDSLTTGHSGRRVDCAVIGVMKD